MKHFFFFEKYGLAGIFYFERYHVNIFLIYFVIFVIRFTLTFKALQHYSELKSFEINGNLNMKKIKVFLKYF